MGIKIKKRKKAKLKRGFTLIEILAAVTILGILSIVAIVSVNKVIQKSKQNHYITAEDNLEMAGQSYVQQNRNILPKTIGQKTKIPLKTLVDKNYIEPIKDYSDNECDLDNSYVQVFKYSKEDYSYVAYLDCPIYNSKEQIEKGSPTITITLTNPQSTKTAKANIKVEDQEKLLSWSYIIYKNGKDVLNSGSMMLPNYEKVVEKILNISKYTPGKIKVVVTATNIYGLTKTTTSEVKDYKDEQAPTCIIKEVDKETNPKDWTKTSKTITVGCDDGEGSGCTREEYTKTFKTTTDVGTIKIEDKSGNITNCRVSVNVDTTAPECTITFSGTKGLAGWYKSSNANVLMTTTDAHSGVDAYDLTTSTTPTYNGSNTNTQGDTSNQTWYGYVKDKVGNINNCVNIVKVDTTAPECTVTLSGTSGTNDWYKENAVTVTLNPSDGLSGVGKTGLSAGTEPTLGSKTSDTQGDTTGVIWYGQVQDRAGNIGQTCNSGSFKVDTTIPSISWSTSAGPHNNSTGITVYTSCADDLSGVSSHTGSSFVSSPTSGTSKTHSCTDNAGNTATTSRTFKVKYFSRDSDCEVDYYKRCSSCSCAEYSTWSTSTTIHYVGHCDQCTLDNPCRTSSSTYKEVTCDILGGSISGEKGYAVVQQTTKTRSCDVRNRCSACGVEQYKECWHY